MSNLKKLLCNPPAEMVARHGDMKVCGMFIGAGKGLGELKNEKLRDEFAKRITDAEESYMSARQVICDNTIRTMDQIFRDMVKSQGNGKDKEQLLGAALDYVAPKEDPKGKGNL